MSQHMVIFQNPDGDPGYNQFESIEEAVGFVEKIRNEQGIDSIRIFELDEVKFDLKPYFKVELQALNAGSAPSRPAPAPAPAAAPSPSAAPTAPTAPAPAPAPAPSPSAAPASEPTSGSTSGSTSPFAPPTEPSPGYSAPQSAPTPPADQPQDDSQPTRRGLFGR